MEKIGLQQFSLLLLGVTMTAVGVLGLTGALSSSAILLATILVTVALLAFHIGQISAQARRY